MFANDVPRALIRRSARHDHEAQEAQIITLTAERDQAQAQCQAVSQEADQLRWTASASNSDRWSALRFVVLCMIFNLCMYGAASHLYEGGRLIQGGPSTTSSRSLMYLLAGCCLLLCAFVVATIGGRRHG